MAIIGKRFNPILALAICSGLAMTGTALSQSLYGAEEQNILTSPSAPEIGESSSDLRDLIEICVRDDARQMGALEDCNSIITRAISGRGERIIKEDTLRSSANESYLSAYVSNNERIVQALELQQSKSEYIFWLIIVIVSIGVITAVVQFYVSAKAGFRDQADISVSEKSIAIKTAWIGVVLLLISMGFFYLYLKYIYTVTLLTPE